jgi:transcriptional regulator with XRE-family HTH domain
MDTRARIRQRIEALETSARAVSIAAGLSTHFLQKYLANPDHSIKVENLRALAPVLETTPEWLLSGIGPEHQDPGLEELKGVWSRIPTTDHATALRVLEGFTKKSNEK